MKHKITIKLMSLFAGVIFAGIASAQHTGFMSPTDTALPHGWTNPTFGYISDAKWATANHQSGCNCPYLALSWNKGTTYTSNKILGPFGNSDSWQTAGSPTDLWGHVWIDSELNNSNFRVKLSNSSTLISQGYSKFNLVIPGGATIDGIEAEIQFHGDSAFSTDYLNALEVDVYYTAPTGISSVATATTQNIQVFPNPAHDKLTLNTFGLSNMRYALLAIDGRMIFEQKAEAVNFTFSTTIPLTNIPAGVYMLRVVSDQGTSYKKVLVQ